MSIILFFKVLKFRHKSLGESLGNQQPFWRRLKENNITPIPEAQKQRAWKPYKQYNTQCSDASTDSTNEKLKKYLSE